MKSVYQLQGFTSHRSSQWRHETKNSSRRETSSKCFTDFDDCLSLTHRSTTKRSVERKIRYCPRMILKQALIPLSPLSSA